MNKMLLLKIPLSLSLLVCLAFSEFGTTSYAKTSPEKASAEVVDNFRLTDHQGKSYELYRQTQAPIVVLFVAGNGCPIVRQSLSTLKTLRERFADQKVVFWLLNANPQDDQASVVEEATEFGIDFPVLMDKTQIVARSLKITRTAEVIAISTKDWKVEIGRASCRERV